MTSIHVKLCGKFNLIASNYFLNPSIPPTVSLTVTPERSQFFKFDHFSVSCEEEEQTTKWSVMKMTEDREVCVEKPSLLDTYGVFCCKNACQKKPRIPSGLFPCRCINIHPPAPSLQPSLPQIPDSTGVKLDWEKPVTLSTSPSLVDYNLVRHLKILIGIAV